MGSLTFVSPSGASRIEGNYAPFIPHASQTRTNHLLAPSPFEPGQERNLGRELCEIIPGTGVGNQQNLSKGERSKTCPYGCNISMM